MYMGFGFAGAGPVSGKEGYCGGGFMILCACEVLLEFTGVREQVVLEFCR